MSIISIIISFYAVLSVAPNGLGYYCSEISYPVFEYEFCNITYQGQEVEGQCKSFKNCSTAIYLWRSQDVIPTTCWYNGFDHVVCCPHKLPLNYLPSITETASITKDKILSSNRRRTNSFITPSSGTTPSSDTTPSSSTTSAPMQTTTTERPRFVLPKINDECFASDSGLNGTCQHYSDCPSAMKLWKTNAIYPEHCVFDIVCCFEKRTDSSLLRNKNLRKNVLACESRYQPKFYRAPAAAGIAAKPMEFPYMAALGWVSEMDNTTSYRCGGVLISPLFLLTAAHCTSARGQPPVRVKLGGDNLTDTTFPDLNISQIFVHPMYDSETSANDIALIQLPFNISWSTACLWNELELEMNNLTALGYGNIRFGEWFILPTTFNENPSIAGPSSDHLIKALLLSVPTSECQKSYDEELLDTHLCAGESKNDTCQGDSGGPLLMYRNSKFYPYVVGITSFGNPCVGGSPGVYTRVSEYIDWIESIVWNE